MYKYETIQTPGFVRFGHLSSGVDPVVNSHIRPGGHFTGGTENITIKTNRG